MVGHRAARCRAAKAYLIPMALLAGTASLPSSRKVFAYATSLFPSLAGLLVGTVQVQLV